MGLAAAGLLALGGCGSGKTEPAFNPADSSHVNSYMMGRGMSRHVLERKELGADINDEILLLALKEALAGVPSRLSDSVLQAADLNFNREINARRRDKRQQIEEEALKAANDFLEANKTKEGVKVTESGLQYIVLKEGSAPKPNDSDMVKLHYHGTLPDGTVFDSSVDRGEPVNFAVSGVIKGWTEALKLMSVGSKYKIFVPPELAYGRRGARPPIGPNTALVFEMELISVEKKAANAKK
jgi:FKBP-type peptidyl-prolyl cis-trans isomerase